MARFGGHHGWEACRWQMLLMASALLSVCICTARASDGSVPPAAPAPDPDQYMVLEYLWSFPKPEDIRAGILRTFSRPYNGEPRVSVENSVPALQSIDEIASAAYGQESSGRGLLGRLRQLAPPVLGVASGAALSVLAKSKVQDLLSKPPPPEKVQVDAVKAAPPPVAPPPKTEAAPPKMEADVPKMEADSAGATGVEKSDSGAGKEEKEAVVVVAKTEEVATTAEGRPQTKEEVGGGVAAETKGEEMSQVDAAVKGVEKEAVGTGGVKDSGGGVAFALMPARLGGGLWSKWFQRGGVNLRPEPNRCSTRRGQGTTFSAYKRRGGVRWLRASRRDDDESVQEPAGFEKFFAGLFGSIGAAPEQVGLQRFDRTKFPELYPATLTEFADILPTDTEEMQIFRPLLAQTSLEQREVQLVFDANRDGWEAAAFHRAVDRLGPGVVLARTQGGAVVGGYNPKGWVGYGEYRGSIAAFLFTYPDGDLSQPAIKLRKVGGSSLACVDDPESGPRFGADGFHAPLLDSRSTEADGTERIARCKLGPYYERRADGSNSIFAPGESNTGTYLTDLKVFVGVYGADEEIPFNDALPIQLE